MLPLLALLACNPPPADSGAPPPSPVFSFAVLADTHLTGGEEARERLARAVTWIGDHAEARSIELVLVLGDISWGAGREEAPEVLAGLPVPYVPVIGDNEVHAGEASLFADTHAGALADLEALAPDLARLPVPATDPEGAETWLQVLSFSHRGVVFEVLDLCTRGEDGPLGELGELHDWPGGTLPWLEADLRTRQPAVPGSVVLVSHIPMHLGLLDLAELDRLGEVLAPWDEAVELSLGGHMHADATEPVDQAGYTVEVLDATWDDELRVGVVTAWSDGHAFDLALERVTVP